MKPVQFIFVILLVLIPVLYFSRLRSGVLDRFAVVVFALLGMSMVVFPDWTNWLAHLVGVDSGAHLFIYLSILGLGFFVLMIYSRIRDMQASMTDLIRTIAIDRARPPDAGEDKDG